MRLAALRNRNSAFVIDGDVLLGVDGCSDFNEFYSRRHDAEVEFYAFDCLVCDSGDLRRPPLSMRKTNLARLLACRVDGIHLAPFEQGAVPARGSGEAVRSFLQQCKYDVKQSPSSPAEGSA